MFSLITNQDATTTIDHHSIFAPLNIKFAGLMPLGDFGKSLEPGTQKLGGFSQ